MRSVVSVGLRAVVRQALADVECRQRHHDDYGNHRSYRDPRPPRHELRPAPPRGGTLLLPPTAAGALAGEAEQRRQQRYGNQHGDRHRPGRRQPHHRQERDADHDQADERDQHGHSGEHDRAAGRGGRARDRLGGIQPVGELLAVARHDEQRVVDPHRQAQHGRQCGSHRVDLSDCGQRGDRRQPDRHAENRGHQRQPRKEQRAEGDEQHDEGGDHADHLSARLLALARADNAARELDLQTRLARRPRDPLERLLRRIPQILDRDSEVEIGEADRPVARRREALDELLARGDGLRHRPGALDRRIDDLLVPRLVERVSLRGCEHEPRRRAAAPGELLVQQVERTLRLSARDVERVVCVLLDRLRRHHHRDEQREPESKDDPPAPRRPAPEAIQVSRHPAPRPGDESQQPSPWWDRSPARPWPTPSAVYGGVVAARSSAVPAPRPTLCRLV